MPVYSKLRISLLSSVFLFAMAANAGAVSLTLGGSGPASGEEAAQVLYASNSRGNPAIVTEIGRDAPDGAAFTEIGVPQMAPDGRVIFGAEETEIDGRQRWNIFFGDPEASPARRVTQALHPKASQGTCFPQFRTDPYPVAGIDGEIAFIAADSTGRDSLFLYSQGALSCLAAAGSQTIEGHSIAVLSHGTVQIGEFGHAVFTGWLKADKPSEPSRQALLMASAKTGIVELAVEGELGPNRTRYKTFGLPAVLLSTEGTLIAFTAKTESGAALFLYRDGVMARVLPTGTDTGMGPVSYLSPGRPGLMADGTMAVLAGCARIPAIFRLARGRLDLRIRRGQLTPQSTLLEALGDPVLTQSGAMFVGATDSENREKLYVLDDDAFFEVGTTAVIYRIALEPEDEHSIFTGTLTANQHGDFAYLGGK